MIDLEVVVLYVMDDHDQHCMHACMMVKASDLYMGEKALSFFGSLEISTTVVNSCIKVELNIFQVVEKLRLRNKAALCERPNSRVLFLDHRSVL